LLDLRPFTGDVVHADRARRVVAPPYDALDPEVRAALAATDPDSYLGALPPGGPRGDASALDTALARCRRHLDALVAAGRFVPIGGPAVAVLELRTDAHRAVAIVGDLPVAAFADGRVLPHEQVDRGRVHDLMRYLEVVGVASSPVAITQRPDGEVTAATAAATAGAPADVAYRADDGADVALWCVTDGAVADRLRAAVAGAGVAYIADGHHRAAAAARYATVVGAGPDDAAGRVLSAIVPSDHLDVQPFHRRLDDVLTVPGPGRGGDPAAEVEALLARLRAAGVGVRQLPTAATPDRAGTVTLAAAGGWWQLEVSSLAVDGDVVESLDVRLVERDLVPRVTDRSVPVVPVAAPLGLEALTAPGSVGFALYPPTVDQVLAVADAGRDVPPKTTYIAPKLRSGLLVTPRPRPDRAAQA
jgi:uncharacterized protein (DUF1015 family)